MPGNRAGIAATQGDAVKAPVDAARAVVKGAAKEGLRSAREVDLVDLSTERGVIASQVLSRGVLIIKKDRDLLARFIKRTWLDRADLWPHRERIFASRRKKAFGA